MTNKVLLNNIDHGALRVIARHAPEYGDSVNQVLVFPTEFEEIQREYPIFFRKDANGDFQSVALLGLDRDENLFLGDGGWQGRYVPAILRRGPFSISLQRQEVDGELQAEPMIHVDLDDPRVGDGQPVFLSQGGNTPYLEHIAEVLRTIHRGHEVAQPMFDAFGQAGLIRPVAVEIQLDDATQYNLPNLYTVRKERLAELDGPALERLNAAGFLQAAFMILSSLANVSRLIDLKNRKRAIA